VAVGLILAASVASSSRVAQAAQGDTTPDEVTLRDGRHLKGRIVERVPGQWIVLETEDGRRHTFAWDNVEELEVAPAPAGRPPSIPTMARDAWRKRSGGGVTYEVRAAVATLGTPDRNFGVNGFCSTGGGIASASIYGQTARAGGLGFGGGVGGRLGYMYRSPFDPDGASSWWGLRAGMGLDIQAFHLHAPVGIRPLTGQLCSQVAKTSHVVQYEGSPIVVVQVPLNFGGHIAFGKLDDSRWRGLVLGAAWAPSFVHIGLLSGMASSHVNPLGLELTLDFSVLHAGAQRPEPQIRVALSFAPQTDDSQPTSGALSLGIVWY
jgi:hypothetical protein